MSEVRVEKDSVSDFSCTSANMMSKDLMNEGFQNLHRTLRYF